MKNKLCLQDARRIKTRFSGLTLPVFMYLVNLGFFVLMRLVGFFVGFFALVPERKLKVFKQDALPK